ncbi:MAG TPA: heavy metal translocating P-type ATPase [Candidatus Acidoferrales bacterium]|nr:heavy metal translocating P-type ATPase [Candidatus Acidoferrales bacterium]
MSTSTSGAVASVQSRPARKRLEWLGPRGIAFFTVAALAAHLALRYLAGAPQALSEAPLIAAIVIGGVPMIVSLVRKLLHGEFGADHLAAISIITAVLLREYLVAGIVILMLSGGTALEEFATRRASSVLDALARRVPQFAHRKSGIYVADVKLEEIAVGDVLVVFPHEICPVDGVVLEGRGKMNEAYLTGEPFEIEKVTGSSVISGAVNGDAALEIRAEKLPVDSRYARIMRVMQEAEQRKPRMRRLADKLGAWYTPIALVIAGIGWAVSGQPHRFLAVVVVATPCPLLIGIPVAVIGGISLAARRGIITKNPSVLENIDRCQTVIFDKTGTLTYGTPELSEILCAPGFTEDHILQTVASIERYSKHPLAIAVQQAAEKRHLAAVPVSQISEPPGEGLRGIVGGRTVWITSRKNVTDPETVLPPMKSGLECVVFLSGEYAATFRFQDMPRKDSRNFVRHLRPRHGVTHVMIVSGDRDAAVRHLAGQVGIGEVHAGVSPEEKVTIVREEVGRAPTLFLGDGINDAPAMQAATVGVAFGAQNDITTEAADAVVLESSLSRVDELIHIAKRTRRIALESAVGGMALSIAGMIAAALGYLPPIGGAVAQELIDLAAVLNSVRVAISPRSLTDFD